MAQVFSYPERARPLPLTFPMTIVARDPSVLDPRATDPRRRILRATIDVPASLLQPGPRGPRSHVVDFDASTRKLEPPARLERGTSPAPGWAFTDRFDDVDDDVLLSDPRFRAQNVYAVAAHTLDVFERALGRPVPWAFDSPHLYLVPNAFVEANAYYADVDQALYFGYFEPPGGHRIQTGLAHDIVAHETAHAVLDGLRRRFDAPGLPDQAGFHEGFADIVALLSILSAEQAIAPLIGDGISGRVDQESLSLGALRRSVLVTMGKEFGDALHLNRGGGLRRSVELAPTKAWLDPANREWQEPHRRGEILVAAVMRTFLHLWTTRLEPIIGGPTGEQTIDRARAAEEGAKAARHMLEMSIRAIDYCPPVEFELRDFVTAVLAADREVAPNDDMRYREALIAGFREFGLEEDPPEQRLPMLDDRPVFRRFSHEALRSDPHEVFRFLWENSDFLDGMDMRYYLHVEAVRPAVRVGPRGFVVSETVVDYVQQLILTKSELEGLARRDVPAFSTPSAIANDNPTIKIWGGGTVIFDEFASPKYHHAKPLLDWDRQARRLAYLVDRGLWDTRGRLGFSFGTPLGQRFAEVHSPSYAVGETW